MVKPELGTKRTCVSCGARFYDLMKTPATCPRCETEQPADQPRVRRAAAPVDTKKKKEASPADVDTDGVDIEVEGLDDEDDDSVLEDTSDIEEADDLEGEIEVEVVADDEET